LAKKIPVLGPTNDGIKQGIGLDIDQVEGLSGPQGTSCGKNTTARATGIRTQAPRTSPGARIDPTGGAIRARSA